MTIEKILVPLDGSDLAEAALETALDILNEHPTTTLILVRAAESRPPAGGDRAEEDRALREAESYLNGVVAGLRECGITQVRAAVWSGPAAPTIIEAASAEKVDLIIMTSRGRGGAGAMIFGTVAESVLHGTRTPILVVRDVTSPLRPLLDATEAVAPGDSGSPVSQS
jgi:nucleotide-binding universal stress UspA family protein